MDRAKFDEMIIKHGTVAMYNRGCHCRPCKTAKAAAQKRYRAKRKMKALAAEMFGHNVFTSPTAKPHVTETEFETDYDDSEEQLEELPYDFRDLLAEVENSGLFRKPAAAPVKPISTAARPVAKPHNRKPSKPGKVCQYCGAQPGLNCAKLITVTGGSLGGKIYQLCERCGGSEMLAGATEV